MTRDDLPPWPVVATALGGPALAAANGLIGPYLTRVGAAPVLAALCVAAVLAFGYSTAGLAGAALDLVRNRR